MEHEALVGSQSNKYELLATGKPHISFSELRDWRECSYRHFLKNIKKIDLSKPGPFLDFGTAVHATLEKFIKTRELDVSVAVNTLNAAWEKNKGNESYNPVALGHFVNEAKAILEDVPAFFETTFPGWQAVAAELALYEPVIAKPHAFKGFVDCIISAPGPRKKQLTWILDAKTCSWGWPMEKKNDDLVRMQLVLYKHFWSAKTGANTKDVRCGFVLLKRTAKPGFHCELVPVSVGDVTTERAVKTVNNMLASIKRGTAIKNHESCQWCEYKGTEHCK